MFSYYLKLSLLSIKRNPVLSTLMMAAIAVGIGAFITMLTVYHIQSGNPLWYKNDQVYHPQIDMWNPDQPYRESKPDSGPDLFTYRDAMALHESDIPTYKVATFKTGDVILPESDELAPFRDVGRMTYNDFFQIFDVPFLYGGAWDDRADQGGEFVVVLSRELNDKLFGGENSVGERVRIGDHEFTVTGVLDEWYPVPKFYDLTNGAFQGPEEYFMPFQLLHTLESPQWGNTNCWKSEDYGTGDEVYPNFVNGECIWITYWVQLDTEQQQEEYMDFLAAYSSEQAELGRSARPENQTINTVEEWLEWNEVVGDDNRVLVGLSFLFLVVCLLNTVGLLLAKFMGRAGEISVRRALGASRLDVFRQQLIECGSIGVVGGMAGIGLAALGVIAVKKMYSFSGPAGMDMEMVVTAFVTAILASIAAGLWPAWQITRVPPAGYLKTQ